MREVNEVRVVRVQNGWVVHEVRGDRGDACRTWVAITPEELATILAGIVWRPAVAP